MPKEWRRRAELRRAAKRLKQLSQERVPVMTGEDVLRERVRRHLANSARYGIDDDVLQAVDEVIESHVIEMQAEILRRHTAEDIELGKLEVELDGIAKQYGYERDASGHWIRILEYQLRMALRGIEDRDTPTPAGPDGEEEPGYQHGNVGELAGRSLLGLGLLYLVLALAMVADLITFRQVIERVLNDSLVFPLVVALTATTTYVAHWSGEGFKQAEEERRGIRRALSGWLLGAVWLAMGLGAFFFRLLAPPMPGASSTDAWVDGNGVASAADGHPALSATLMLLLYVLTGAIAFTAGYRRPRAEIAQFKRSNRRLRRARPRHSALERDVVEATSLGQQLAELRDSRRRQYAVEIDRCQSAARRIRAEVVIITNRLRIAGRLPLWQRLVKGGRSTPVISRGGLRASGAETQTGGREHGVGDAASEAGGREHQTRGTKPETSTREHETVGERPEAAGEDQPSS